MILITAANGNQGKLLVPKMVASGVPVRASVRSPGSAAVLHAAGASEVVVGDLSDPAVLAHAVRGVDRIYHVGPTLSSAESKIGFAMIDAARAAGVQHLVLSSVLHAITTDLVQHRVKRDVEEHLLSSGLEFTILQPANYMLAHRLRSPFERGVFELSWSLERRQSLVDLRDVTDVAAMVLADPARHAGATYELAAPGRYTAHDLGGIIATVLGRPVDVREIDADAFAERTLRGADLATREYRLRAMRAITARYSSHDFVGNPNVLTWLLGRTPTTFEEFVRAEHAAFQHRQSTPPTPHDL